MRFCHISWQNKRIMGGEGLLMVPIADEMGKTIVQARAEVLKCAAH